jgi:type IV pilus assembly protein PilA
VRILKLILKWALITFGVLVGLSFILGGGGFLLEIPFKLAFGWIGFLSRNLEAMEPNWLLVAEGAACAIAFGVGGHYFSGWLWRSMAPAGSGAWRAGWSVAGAGGVLLVFVAGIATVGITHQTAWLFNAKGPFLVDDFTDRARVSQALIDAASARTAIDEFFQRTGRLPQSAAEAGIDLKVLTGRYTRSVGIDPGGIVHIEISEELGGGTFSLTPTPKGNELDWKCSSTLERKLTPAACRN